VKWQVVQVAAGLVLGFAALFSVYLLESVGAVPHEIAPVIIYGCIVLVVGLVLVRAIGVEVLRLLRPSIGDRAFTIKNAFQIIGYATVGVTTLAVFGVSPEVALAGGTVTGLVLGLGAQLVFSNFFAGVVILATSFIKPGDEIRLLTPSLPYQATLWPTYKYFSPDYANYGYRAKVVEVGLIFSMLVTDTGLGMKVPNQIILNAGVVDYRSGNSPNRLINVRYEFSVDHDPDALMLKVNEALSDIKEVTKVIFNEQSDKQYFIILIQFRAETGTDWTIAKSEILRRLVRVQRSLEKRPGTEGTVGSSSP
jgi:small-conductance mechanosensitive channel